MNQPVPPKHFNKLVEMNPNISYAINTLIAEYDIQRCHPTCMYFLKGKEFYDQLMKMPKFDSNVLIGKMMKEDLTLSDKIGNLKLKFFNDFCKLNNIKDSNFISSTVDSMLLVNKKPMKTKLENGIVNFRNKDGEFIGGLIAPGIKLQINALNKFTSKLPRVEFAKSKKPIGDSTQDAILSGIVRGTSCMIEGMIKQCEIQLGTKATVVATGGYASFIEEYMGRKFDFINPTLTLEGLRYLYELNKN